MLTKTKVHAVGCDLSTSELADTIKKITKIPSLGRPPVCLPDIHNKPLLEAPSSLTVATRNTIIPTLSTSSLGCGMGVITTSLKKEEITPELFENFYDNISKDTTRIKSSMIKNFMIWLGLSSIPIKKYDVTEKELSEIIISGAAAVVKKYGLPEKILSKMEGNGDFMDDSVFEKISINRIIPRSGWKFGRHNLGYEFGGNHFLEIQYVEKIIDEKLAEEWGLRKNQIVIMYHGGDGKLCYYLGRYFSTRIKHGRKERLIRFPAKLWFHFSDILGIFNAGKRWKYYFQKNTYQEIPTDTYEGLRIFSAINAALNYGAASRLTLVKRVFDSLRLAMPSKNIEMDLLWDVAHTSIIREKIDDEELIVHRNATTRVVPGKPVIISGHSTTNSYIGVGLKEAESRLFSADHGAGSTIKKIKHGARPHPENHVTSVFEKGRSHTAQHITNEGLEFVVKHLENEKIVRPVVFLRPLAVLKEE